MKTPIEIRNLTEEAPHSPRERYGGFAILARTVDKCRASIAGTLGEYHFDCPLDNQLFDFKGITAHQFKIAVVSAKNYEDIADWLTGSGTPRTPGEIQVWSDRVETAKLKDIAARQGPDHQQELIENCRKLGLNFETVTLFDWLDADDEACFQENPHVAAK